MTKRTTTIRYTSFPATEPPPGFVPKVVSVFQKHETDIATERLAKGLTSDQVLAKVAKDLSLLGFQVETGKSKHEKIDRPVFYGENGAPTLRYKIDAFHPRWRCGLEIEAGRAWMGNAIYRDIVQALVMVQIEHLCLAVPNKYKYKTNERNTSSPGYANTVEVARALFGHSRIKFPYRMTVIGY